MKELLCPIIVIAAGAYLYYKPDRNTMAFLVGGAGLVAGTFIRITIG